MRLFLIINQINPYEINLNRAFHARVACRFLAEFSSENRT